MATGSPPFPANAFYHQYANSGNDQLGRYTSTEEWSTARKQPRGPWIDDEDDEWDDDVITDWNWATTWQWFDSPPLYNSPALPLEWDLTDRYRHLPPVAYADFQNPWALQWLHERGCASVIRRRENCMASAQTDPYRSCNFWLEAEARCFQSIVCKKELVEFEACTEGADPRLFPLCRDYQDSLNGCMTNIETIFTQHKDTYIYPEDDSDVDHLFAEQFDKREMEEEWKDEYWTEDVTLPVGGVGWEPMHLLPPRRKVEMDADDEETFNPDHPDLPYYPRPIRAPDGSWEEEQYELQRVKKEFKEAAMRNYGTRDLGHVMVKRELR